MGEREGGRGREKGMKERISNFKEENVCTCTQMIVDLVVLSSVQG